MTHVLDLGSGFLCLVISLAFASLWSASSQGHTIWFPIPRYLRALVFTTMVGMLYRGVELINMSKAADMSRPGNIDIVGFIVSLSMASTMVALAAFAWRNRHTAPVISKIKAVSDLERVPKHGAALAALSLEGVAVVPPMGDLPGPPPDP